MPAKVIDEAIAYVQRLYNPSTQTFRYGINYRDPTWTTRGLTGAGILSLSLGGKHNTEMAQRAGDWILRQSFDKYNVHIWDNDSFHYGAYYCTLGMFQLGGRYYQSFYPPLMRTLINNQTRRGHWATASEKAHSPYGETYTTSLALITLSTPYQLLPIFQR